MHDGAPYSLRMIQRDRRRQRAAGGHARDQNAALIGAVRALNGLDLRRDDRSFAVTLDGRAVEPVPAAPWVRGILLARQKDEPAGAIGELRDPRRDGKIFRCLLASVAQREQR